MCGEFPSGGILQNCDQLGIRVGKSLANNVQ